MTQDDDTTNADTEDFLTMVVDGQYFGIPVLQVQDVLGRQNVTRIPLTVPEIDGALNLRGRIVTAINLRARLGLSVRAEGEKSMSVVVEHKSELYSLIVDDVGEVLSLSNTSFEKTPSTLSQSWRDVSKGIYRLEGLLLVVLDVSSMLDRLTGHEGHAA